MRGRNVSALSPTCPSRPAADRPGSMRRCLLATAAATGLISSTSQGQVTELVSLGQGGVQGNSDVELPPPGRFVSSGGRYIAWRSLATNLVPGDTNVAWDVFVRDRVL